MRVTKLQAKALTAFMAPWTCKGKGEEEIYETLTASPSYYNLFVSDKDAKRFAAALSRLLARASEEEYAE